MSYFEGRLRTRRAWAPPIRSCASRPPPRTLRASSTAPPATPPAARWWRQALLIQKDTDGAREQLEWLAAQNKNPSMQSVARLRLAGLLLDQKQYDAALTQLNSPPPAFAALFADRRGDILAAQGKRDEARAAWQSAIDGLGTANPLTQVVQLKLDALSGA